MNIEEYLKSKIVLLNSNISDLKLLEMSEEICNNLCNNYNYVGDKKNIINRIYFLLSNYIKNGVSSEKTISSIISDTQLLIKNPNWNFNNYESSSNNDNSYYNSTNNQNNTHSSTNSEKETSSKSNATSSNDEPKDNTVKNSKTTEEVAEKENKKEPKEDTSTKKDSETTEEALVQEDIVSQEKPKEEIVTVADSIVQVDDTEDVVSPIKSVTSYNTLGLNDDIANLIIDADTDIISLISNKVGKIESYASNLKFDASISLGAVSGLCNEIKSTVEKQKIQITNILSSIKQQMINSMKSVMETDESIEPVDVSNYNFDDIWKKTNEWKGSKPLRKADASFFLAQGCQVNGSTVTLGNYKYNISTGHLSVGGGLSDDSVKFYYYIPNSNDYSKLNTITAIMAEKDVNFNYSNSIVVKAVAENENMGISNKTVANSTRFINSVAKTNLKKAQNMIIGGSKYGAISLKIAASEKDLYKTVFCVNNALIVEGVNGVRGTKEQFGSIEDMKKLDGKRIIFISSSMDPNLSKCVINGKGWPNSNCSIQKSYLYTGLNILKKNCPNAQIYMITNNENSGAFSNLSSGSSNFHYQKNYWNKIMQQNYSSHASYKSIIPDVVSSVLSDAI